MELKKSQQFQDLQTQVHQSTITRGALEKHMTEARDRYQRARFDQECFNEINKKLIPVKAALARDKRLYDLLGPKGKMISAILSGALDALTNRANKILYSMNSSFSISIETYEIYVTNPMNQKIPVFLASGYQQFVIDLALTLAFYMIRRSAVLDCFFIDEGFGCLDDKNVKSVGNALSLFAKRHRDIIFLAVTHREEMIGFFDQVLTITRAGGISSIKC